MSLNAFPFLYEEATWEDASQGIRKLLEGLPPLRPDMKILDLACGTGSATRVIHDVCRAKNIEPPKVTGVDVGPNFIDAFHENKVKYGWSTAEGIV